jgi:hypothetical protein
MRRIEVFVPSDVKRRELTNLLAQAASLTDRTPARP